MHNNNSKICNKNGFTFYTEAAIPPHSNSHQFQTSSQPTRTGIADSGATDHYLAPADSNVCTNVTPTTTGPTVTVANGTQLKTTHQATIPLAPQLKAPATTGNILHGLKSGTLISIGKLCDDDCIALFTKYHVHIVKNGEVIIKGKRDFNNGLWQITLASKPVKSPCIDFANSAISTAKTKSDLAAFLHGAAFSPSKSTFLRAINKGQFSTWPGLTSTLISKQLQPSQASAQGHLRGQQKHVNSTRPSLETPPLPLSVSLDVAPSREPSNLQTSNAFVTLLTEKEFARSYSDQTGKFLTQSNRGNNYIFVFIIMTQMPY